MDGYIGVTGDDCEKKADLFTVTGNYVGGNFRVRALVDQK